MRTEWSEMKASLCLEDGSVFQGISFGASTSTSGEIVFQTGMVGYVESLTDPSYHRQLLTLTYPLVGNYGVPTVGDVDGYGLPKHLEAHKIWPSALIIDHLCEDEEASHWESVMSLSTWLHNEGVPGIRGVDTRELTKKIREHGTMKAKIIVEGTDPSSIPYVDINVDNLVENVSTKRPYKLHSKAPSADPASPLMVMVLDVGMKLNQLRCLLKRGVSVTVVPWEYDFKEEEFDGLFLSNGPGDPAMCQETVGRLEKLLSTSRASPVSAKPIMGICLGHQLLARAAGATTYKLRYGNRGHNQPCVHHDTGRCFITAQNHGYAVEPASLPAGDWVELFRNKNDSTNEGIVHMSQPFFSVQFHPEHCAGPMDMELLFDVFVEAIKDKKMARNSSLTVRQRIEDVLRFPISSLNSPLPPKPSKVILLGSGGLSIGQAGEFDYSGSQALKALREEGVRTILINPNVATVQTCKGFADKIMFVPVEPYYVEQAIKMERPDSILLTFGGQTALNCGVDLENSGVFVKYGVKVLGTPINSVILTEDRQKFAEEMAKIGEPCAPSRVAYSVGEALVAGSELEYPVLVRAAYALGGLGSGLAKDPGELEKISQLAFAHSSQVLVDKSLHGWKEVEYEVVRDRFNNCITVCNMENLDPVGIHTGESVVVAPSQTLNNREYNMLRESSIKVIQHLGIVGECNIQFALNPKSLEYFIIEVNARLSRSSALASKATGYPLAYIAAKLGLGYGLPELSNSVTGGKTTACFEPSLDYCVVKIPRWDLSKFMRVSTEIGTSMKSVGEVMGIGRCFEEAFQKALRMASESCSGFDPTLKEASEQELTHPTDKRLFVIAAALYDGYSVDRIHKLTAIDKWFLNRLANIIDKHKALEAVNITQLTRDSLLEAKQMGFADRQIAACLKSNELAVRTLRTSLDVRPCVKQIDTVAAEWPAVTNYLYLTYSGSSHDPVPDPGAIMVLGSGVYRIGSSVEFDCCSVGCTTELRKLGYRTIMVNCNPETVSTDYDMCDRLYFEEICFETVVDICNFEQPKGVILSMGGQSPNNIAVRLHRQKIPIFGTSPDMIDTAENRFKFSRMCDQAGIAQPRWKELTLLEDAKAFCAEVGYPCLVRPSYVLSGAAMNVAFDHGDLEHYLKQASVVSKDHPVVISKFIQNAKEIDVDAIAADGMVKRIAISEHVENAGVHSGDATLITPPQDLTPRTVQRIREIMATIAAKLQVNGPFNCQLIAKDDNLKVIECNLRVSRSFPFVSKTLGCDLIADATRVMMNYPIDDMDVTRGCGKIGVKVPVFSFSRLSGADVCLGVEMSSTGEVAGFGSTPEEAYLKALLGTGFKSPPIPKGAILLSVGHHSAREELLESVLSLHRLGFRLFGSIGTADFYSSTDYYKKRNCDMKITPVEWPFESSASPNGKMRNDDDVKGIGDYVASKEFDLIINIPKRGRGAYRVSSFITNGYKTRRMAVDNGIPLVTDIKCAKLMIKAFVLCGARPPIKLQLDCLSSARIIRLPGLIDVHVHTRSPGEEHKEDWESVTKAALAGGVTMILAMPNTKPPLSDVASMERIGTLAKSKACCDFGLHAMATGENAGDLVRLLPGVVGLKMYLNQTHNSNELDKMGLVTSWMEHFEKCPLQIPILVHAVGGRTMSAVMYLVYLYKRPVHVCHVSTKEEISIIRAAKERGMPVTCEVCPHHLILTRDSRPMLKGGPGEVRPPLATEEDRQALWDNLDIIDVFSTDHAPHLWSEKTGDSPPPGFPGLETMLPLLLDAVNKRMLTLEDVIARLHDNPRRIFGLPEQPDTYVEIDMDEEFTIPAKPAFSRAGWTPYAGMTLRGMVRRVIVRHEEAFVDGKVLVPPGFGIDIRRSSASSLSHNVSSGLTPLTLDTSSGPVTSIDVPSRSHAGIQVSPGIPPAGPLSMDFATYSPSSFKMKEEYRTVLTELKRRTSTTELSPVSPTATKSVRLGALPLPSAGRSNRSAGSFHRRRDTSIQSNFLPDQMYNPLGTNHVLSVDQFVKTFKRDGLFNIFELASALKNCVVKNQFLEGRSLNSILEGCRMTSLFYEVSTRTSCSFKIAMELLGGQVDEVVASASSIQKGETLEDTIRVMTGYRSNVVVLRHPEVGAARRASLVSPVPVLNAGDGAGEHPTQALLDVFTIREEIGTVNKLTVTLVGDLKHGRTVHSLAKLLTLYDIRFRYVSPPGLEMPAEVIQYVRAAGKHQEVCSDLEAALLDTDVLYVTRIQKERFANLEEYEKVCGRFVVTPHLMSEAKEKMIVLHPLPRVDEISPEFDLDPRAAYFRQAENGLFVRMALLMMVTGGLDRLIQGGRA